MSFVGNLQHNPGEPLHWAREKSTDHADCIARHLLERGTVDADGIRHSAKLAWRALALLQIEIEEQRAADSVPSGFVYTCQVCLKDIREGEELARISRRRDGGDLGAVKHPGCKLPWGWVSSGQR